MAHPQETRAELRRLYVFDQKSLPEAAEEAGIPLATARQWKNKDKAAGDDWDKQKAAYMMAGGGLENVNRAIMASFLLRYQETMDDVERWQDMTPLEKVDAITRLSDGYAKTVATNKKLLPEISEKAAALRVIERLLNFTKDKYPKHLAAVIEVLEPFGKVIDKELE